MALGESHIDLIYSEPWVHPSKWICEMYIIHINTYKRTVFEYPGKW